MNARDRSIFVSALTYELGRQLGIERAAREFQKQCEAPTRDSLPVARMVARLRSVANVSLFHAASTTLPKARSRAAHEALRSGADFWLMCDDDVECDSATLQRLLALAGEPDELGAAVLPCFMRGAGGETNTLNVQFAAASLLTVGPGGPSRRAERAGTGCMVISRGALQRVTERFRTDLAWQDDDGLEKVALFQLVLDGRKWLGEDFSFCYRLHEAGIALRALLSGSSSHAGQVLQLDSLR